MHMKKILISALFGLTLASCGETSIQDLALTAEDWAAVCDSGTLDDGCKGDISSEAMQKINLVGRDFLGNTSIHGSGAKTVWIQQIGTGTSCIESDARVGLAADFNSTEWSCGVALPQAVLVGVSVEILGGSYLGFDNDIGVSANLSTKIPRGTNGDVTTFAIFPPNSSTMDITAYVICVSTSAIETGEVRPFEETPKVLLNGERC